MFEFIFTFKCVKVDKKLSKKKTENFKLVFCYLNKSKRLFYIIKMLFYYSSSFNSKMSVNLFYALNNTFLLLKNSFIYKQKLKFYQKILASNLNSENKALLKK